MGENGIDEILKYKVVAVVGLSKDPEKSSHIVGSYLKHHGYHIIPINPTLSEVLNEKCYKSLHDIPHEIQQTIEVVDIFRSSKDVPPIVEQAISIKRVCGKPFVVWMQLGVVNEEAAEAARHAGLVVVMDKCMKREHSRLTQ